MSDVWTFRIPLALWRAAARKADEAGLPTSTWLLAVITRAVQDRQEPS